MNTDIKGISVIICCYNGVQRLPQTLYHLAQQRVPYDLPWEVIIMDNNSTDETRTVSQNYAIHFPSNIPYRVVSEKRSGKTYALESGILLSSYSYILVVDDDNWLAEDYISTAFERMESDLSIAIAGGQSEAAFENDLPTPRWFTTYQGYYAIGKQFMSLNKSCYTDDIWGAGMVIRKSALYALKEKGFEYLLKGRSGKMLTTGEDTELCKAFLLAGFKLFYEDRLKLTHFMSTARLSNDYLLRLTMGTSFSQAFLIPYGLLLKKTRMSIHLSLLIIVLRNFYFLLKVLVPNYLLAFFSMKDSLKNAVQFFMIKGTLKAIFGNYVKITMGYHSIKTAPWNRQ